MILLIKTPESAVIIENKNTSKTNPKNEYYAKNQKNRDKSVDK